MLKEIRRQFIGSNSEKIYMVADGHSAHRSKIAKVKMRELKIDYVRMPAYSPQLNSIERLWAFVKKAVVHQLALAKRDLSLSEFKSLVMRCCKTVSPDAQLKAALLNNHRYIMQLLKARNAPV